MKNKLGLQPTQHAALHWLTIILGYHHGVQAGSCSAVVARVTGRQNHPLQSGVLSTTRCWGKKKKKVKEMRLEETLRRR